MQARIIIIPAHYVPAREVRGCFECPHFKENQGEWMDTNVCEYDFWSDTPPITDQESIPAWCPLL